MLAHGDAADLAAAALEIVEHIIRRLVHLLAQALGDDGDVDIFKQLMRVGAQPAAVERGQDALLAAQFRVVDRGIQADGRRHAARGSLSGSGSGRDGCARRRGSARWRACRPSA